MLRNASAFALTFSAVLVLGAIALLLGGPAWATEDPPKAPPDPGMGDPGMADPPPPGNGGANPNPPPKVEPFDAVEATNELSRLEKYLKDKKADNTDINASMEAVLAHYKRAMADEKANEAWLKSADTAFVKALTLVKVRPNSTSNERDDVNVNAAKVLGQTRPDVTPKIRDALEKVIFEAKMHTPPTALYDEAFKSIGKLNDKRGLAYAIEWIVYVKKPGDAEKIKAAFEGLALFTEVEGTKRYEIVKEILKVFQPVEHAAEVNKTKEDRAQKDVWEKIKASVVKATQYYAGEPKWTDRNGNSAWDPGEDDEKGALIATLKDFQAWLRENDNPKKSPWADPKIEK